MPSSKHPREGDEAGHGQTAPAKRLKTAPAPPAQAPIAWDDSLAKHVLERDMAEGGPLYRTNMKPMKAWEMYRNRREFHGIDNAVFRKKFSALKKKAQAPSAQAFIIWDKSPAKHVLERDMAEGGPLYRTNMKPLEAWEMYRERPEFNRIHVEVFQKKFGELKKKAQAPTAQELIIWDKSLAKHILEIDMAEEGPLYRTDKKPLEAWEMYRERPEFNRIYVDVFKKNFADLRKKAFTDDWIDWTNSRARETIMTDLEPEGYLADGTVSDDEAWEFYKTLNEFAGVPKSQFLQQIKEHRSLVEKYRIKSRLHETFLQHDRILYPREMHNRKGEPVFDLHVAKKFLREDIAANRHKGLKPSELRNTKVEYKIFDPVKFKERIYQELRRKKYINYLESKRDKGKIAKLDM